MTERGSQQREKSGASCNVSSSLNFTIGTLSIAAAIVCGYLIWHWLR